MASNILSEFLVSLGFTVDRASADKAINETKRVEEAAVASDKRRTAGSFREIAKQAAREARARGERQRGFAEIKKDLDDQKKAESAAADNSLKAQAKRALATAKTAEQQFKWSRRLVALEKAEQRERETVARRGVQEQRRLQAEAYQEALSRSQGMRSFVHGMVAFSAGLATAATAAFGVVGKVASKFEDTFYTSKRTGASSAGVRAFAYAAEQTGSSREEAIAGLETLAHKIKESPGYEKMLNDLGVQTRDANNKWLEFSKIYMSLGYNLNKRPDEQKIAFGNSLGVPDRLRNSITDPEFIKQYKEYVDMLSMAGLDPAQADKNSKAFMDIWRRLSNTIAIITAKVEGALVGAFGDKLRELSDYLLRNAEPIANGAVRIGEAFVKVVGGIGHLFKKFGDGDNKTAIGEFTKGIDGLATAIGALAAVLTLRLISPLGRALGLLTTLGALKPAAWLLSLLGIPAAVGLAASGGGHMTPEGYKEALAADPGRAAADAELNKQGGAGKRWVQEKWESAKRAIGGTAVGRALGIGQTSATEAPAAGGPTAAIATSPATGDRKDFLDHIARSEGVAGRGDYNASLDYGKWLPEGRDGNLTGKTLDEIDAMQTHMLSQDGNRAKYGNGRGSSAIGRYQIVRQTLRGLRRQLGLNGSEKYDEGMQDRLALHLARQRGANASLGDEWASLRGQKLDRAIELWDRALQQPDEPGREPARTPDRAPAEPQASGSRSRALPTMARVPASDWLNKSMEQAAEINASFGGGTLGARDNRLLFNNPTPLGVGSSSSADNRTFNGGDVHLKIEATGVDGKDIADASVRAWRNQNAETLRNMRSAFA